MTAAGRLRECPFYTAGNERQSKLTGAATPHVMGRQHVVRGAERVSTTPASNQTEVTNAGKIGRAHV